MNELSDYLVGEMGSAYPELYENKDFVKNIILNEELKFRETLDRGLEILNSEISQKNSKKVFSGKKAFELYDYIWISIRFNPRCFKRSWMEGR